MNSGCEAPNGHDCAAVSKSHAVYFTRWSRTHAAMCNVQRERTASAQFVFISAVLTFQTRSHVQNLQVSAVFVTPDLNAGV